MPTHLTFSPNVTATSLRMTVDVSGLGGNSDNVGFDNIQFSQGLAVSSVPGPVAALPFALLALRRRQRA